MSSLAEHLAEIRANWTDMSVSFDSMCVNLVRGHMKELEAFATETDALAEKAARIARLEHWLGVAQGDLFMLKKAIKAGDPRSELLIRATDTERDVRAALENTNEQG